MSALASISAAQTVETPKQESALYNALKVFDLVKPEDSKLTDSELRKLAGA